MVKTTCSKAIVQKKKRTMKLEMFFNILFLDVHSASCLNCKSSAVPSSSSYWFGVGENVDLGVKVNFIGIFFPTVSHFKVGLFPPRTKTREISKAKVCTP